MKAVYESPMRVVQIQQAGSLGRAFSILAWTAEEPMIVHRTALHRTPTVYKPCSVGSGYTMQ